MSEADEQRIDRLEIRLTEQEAVIEDLNATITAQWRAIDALKRALSQLREEIEAAGEGPPGVERPPHY